MSVIKNARKKQRCLGKKRLLKVKNSNVKNSISAVKNSNVNYKKQP